MLGKAFLLNQGCHLVGTEIKLNNFGLKRYSDLDNHTIIDVCGVGLKYLPQGKKRIQQEGLINFELRDDNKYEYGYNILRGIEVKVSRPDFRNGFVCSGCNYHYILTPMRLVAPHEVPKGIGLIEFNKYKFSCKLNVVESKNRVKRPFLIKGLRVIKKPVYRNVPQFQIDNAIEKISENFLERMQTEVIREISGAREMFVSNV